MRFRLSRKHINLFHSWTVFCFVFFWVLKDLRPCSTKTHSIFVWIFYIVFLDVLLFSLSIFWIVCLLRRKPGKFETIFIINFMSIYRFLKYITWRQIHKSVKTLMNRFLIFDMVFAVSRVDDVAKNTLISAWPSLRLFIVYERWVHFLVSTSLADFQYSLSILFNHLFWVLFNFQSIGINTWASSLGTQWHLHRFSWFWMHYLWL